MMHLYGGEFSALMKTVRGTEIFFSTYKIEVTVSSSDDDNDDNDELQVVGLKRSGSTLELGFDAGAPRKRCRYAPGM